MFRHTHKVLWVGFFTPLAVSLPLQNERERRPPHVASRLPETIFQKSFQIPALKKKQINKEEKKIFVFFLSFSNRFSYPGHCVTINSIGLYKCRHNKEIKKMLQQTFQKRKILSCPGYATWRTRRNADVQGNSLRSWSR